MNALLGRHRNPSTGKNEISLIAVPPWIMYNQKPENLIIRSVHTVSGGWRPASGRSGERWFLRLVGTKLMGANLGRRFAVAEFPRRPDSLGSGLRWSLAGGSAVSPSALPKRLQCSWWTQSLTASFQLCWGLGMARIKASGPKPRRLAISISSWLRRHSFLASGQVCRCGFLPMIEGAANLRTARRRR